MTLPRRGSFSSYVRANHAFPAPEPQPAVPAASHRAGGGGRTHRLRPRLLAAGGAVLAQVWGLGFGVGVAHASSATPPSGPVGAVGRTVRSIGVPTTNDPGSGALGVAGAVTGAGSASGGGTSGGSPSGATSAADPEAVDHLLHNKIKAGGLPLPGQATAVPDAFSIAAVLLPAAPRQPGASALESTGGADNGDSADGASAAGGRAAHSGAFPVQRGRTEDGGDGAGAAAPAAWLPATGWDGAATAHDAADLAADRGPTAALSARSTGTAASRDGERTLVGVAHPLAAGAFDSTRLAGGEAVPLGLGPGRQPVAAAPAASSMQASGMETAVLFPIAAGLLLTGAAMYKHRGLPRGH